jgi:hypothetical protein
MDYRENQAWIGQFRRLLVCHERLLSTYRAFLHLAYFRITRAGVYEHALGIFLPVQESSILFSPVIELG